MRTYPFQVPVHYAVRVEVAKPFCHFAELGIKLYISKQSAVEFNDGDGTKRVRETLGFESRYWIILPESAQS